MWRGGVFAIVLALVPQAAASAEEPGTIEFNASTGAPVGALALGEFAPGTLTRGEIETQTPTVRLPITGLHVALRTGGATGCGAGLNAEAALAKASAAPGDPSTGDCLFAADIAVVSARGTLRAEGQCGAWHGTVSYCATEIEAGQFWLRREVGDGKLAAGAKDAARVKHLVLILGPTSVVTVPMMISALRGTAPPSPPPRCGIMLEAVEDDAGRPVTDRWLLLPPQLLKIELER